MATDALTKLVRGKDVRCDKVGADRYRRVVARCFAGGLDLGSELVRLGWAIDYKHYSHGFYAAAEAEARRDRLGLWTGTFEPPSDWRRKHPR